jgi:hypothetical protein
VADANICFLDTETTGLVSGIHEPWEVALIAPNEVGVMKEHRWFLPANIANADPVALSIGRYHERHPKGNAYDKVGGGSIGPRPNPDHKLVEWRDFAQEFVKLTHGMHLVGAIVSFDVDFLNRLIRANGLSHSWHHHIIDIEAMAVGYLKQRDGIHARVTAPPWDSHTLTEELGVTVPEADKHTALGDARWAKTMYEVMMS